MKRIMIIDPHSFITGLTKKVSPFTFAAASHSHPRE